MGKPIRRLSAVLLPGCAIVAGAAAVSSISSSSTTPNYLTSPEP
jgi:hypothetical protein